MDVALDERRCRGDAVLRRHAHHSDSGVPRQGNQKIICCARHVKTIGSRSAADRIGIAEPDVCASRSAKRSQLPESGRSGTDDEHGNCIGEINQGEMRSAPNPTRD